MRIIYPISEPITTDKARFIQIVNTCHALAGSGCSVDIITGCTAGSTEDVLRRFGLMHVKGLRIHGVPMVRAGREARIRISFGPVFGFSCLVKILELAGRGGYGCIYLRHIKLARFLLRFKRIIGLPFVFEAHEVFSVTSDKKRTRRIEDLVYRGVDLVAANSGATRAIVEKTFHFPSDRIEVVRNGVSAKLIESFRQENPRTNGKLVYIGQLYRWKGVECLIEAMELVSRNAVLSVVGGSEESIGRLRELASRKGVENRVLFHGQVAYEDVLSFLRNGQIGVLPLITSADSTFTCPLKLFEYMAAKMAIVASDMPVIREVLRHGCNSILVAPDNPRALAEGINRLLTDEDLSNGIAEQAFSDVSEFTWQNRAARIRKMLEAL